MIKGRLRGRIYLRISDDREGREIGVTRQEIDCRELGDRHEIDIVGVYCDNDLSASTLTTSRRPEYERLLADAAADPGSFVLAYSNGRLTRRPREFEDLLDLHTNAGIQYLTKVSGKDDLSTADGRMVARMKAVVDAAEAERISERVTRASRHRAETGQGHGGTRPFGWSRRDRRRLDPHEHAVLREIAGRILAGDTLRAICRDLTARGVPTATWHPPLTVKPWAPTTLREMMTNPRLYGVRVYKGREVGPGDWEPALDEITVQQLRRVLTDPARKVSPGNVRKNLGTGLFRCGDCGAPVAVKVVLNKGRAPLSRYLCQPCNLYRTQEPIDLYVNAYMRRLLRGYKPTPDPGSDPAAEREAAELRERIAATIERFTGSDAVSEDQLEDILRGLNTRLEAAEARAVPPAPLSPLVAGLTGDDPAVAWSDVPLERQRAVIDALVTVTLHRGLRGRRGFDPDSVRIRRR